MGARVGVGRRDRLEAEQANVAVAALEALEPLHRYPRGARGKLQQPRLLLLAELAPDDLPEPAHHLVGLRKLALVRGVRLPVLHVHLRQPRRQQLKLLEVKRRQQALRDHLVQALQQARQLLLHRVQHGVPQPQLRVLGLVGVRYWDVGAVRLQVHRLGHSELHCGDGEVEAQVVHAVGGDPLEVVVQILVHELEVSDGDWLSQHVLVQRLRQVHGDHVSVQQRLPEHAPRESEVE
mmetsp:Transcript_22531/g.72522  ORF Transcript_22531/g.72522 Transcript_22531/m.72522 type:complete len:236 (-) Transcript_22531:1175-1882(-)